MKVIVLITIATSVISLIVLKFDAGLNVKVLSFIGRKVKVGRLIVVCSLVHVCHLAEVQVLSCLVVVEYGSNLSAVKAINSAKSLLRVPGSEDGGGKRRILLSLHFSNIGA